jgi:hypothetical protein
VEKTGESISEAEKLLEKNSWSRVEVAAMGVFLADIYKGIESTLRLIIEKIYGEKIAKGESWHKDLLSRARALDLIPDGIDGTIDGMRRYRHLQTHGYSVDLDEAPLRANCPEAIEAFYVYTEHVRKKIPEL